MHCENLQWFARPIFYESDQPRWIVPVTREREKTNGNSVHPTVQHELHTLIWGMSVYCWKCWLTSVIACNGFSSSPYCRFSANLIRLSTPPTNICKWFKVVIAEVRFFFAQSNCLMSLVISRTWNIETTKIKIIHSQRFGIHSLHLPYLRCVQP